MALFFDQDWFDARLARAHLTSEAVAAALGVDAEALAEIRKDQRELTPDQVATLATLLAEPVEEVVKRAGIATPTPAAASGAWELSATRPFCPTVCTS